MSEKKIENYAEFWDFYVAEHSQPTTRYLHFIGTLLATVVLIWIVQSGNWLFLPTVLLIGYGFAWYSHFYVEKNKPATFKYPFWSYISDYKMVFYMLIGKMNSEVERVRQKQSFD